MNTHTAADADFKRRIVAGAKAFAATPEEDVAEIARCGKRLASIKPWILRVDVPRRAEAERNTPKHTHQTRVSHAALPLKAPLNLSGRPVRTRHGSRNSRAFPPVFA
ncbi:MAG: hypothetical protein AAFQ96_03525, partial [Pseudomonadota bacterium]